MNPAIQAGAGTGKTTKVVRLLLQRLLSTDTEPSRLLALTFTVRAANEMRDRLGTWLMRLMNRDTVRELGGGIELFDEPERAGPRAHRALAELDRIEMGTIHSFAAHLLRQYPVEAGVSPGFSEDDGSAQARLFRELWPRWLDDRLRLPEDAAAVVHFFDRCELAEIRSFAAALCADDAPIHQGPDDDQAAEWAGRLAAAATEAAALQTHYAGILDTARPRLAESVRYMVELFQAPSVTLKLRQRRRVLDETWPRGHAWQGGARRYQALRQFARRLVDCDDATMEALRAWLRPFVVAFRREYNRRGFVSFQGLLVRAARLLREHADIRERLKRRFHLVLVDEFQDTDPLQGEILLFLAERIDCCESDARRVAVEPGKLVIVGDEKQSIYLFRGADLEAYQAVTRRLTDGEAARVERLGVNFRSRPELVRFANVIGRRTMTAPEYVAIEASQQAVPGGTIEMVLFPHLEAGAARACEGTAIGAWVAAGVAQGRFRAGHVALLLRSLASAEHYTEALRAHGVEFLIEGEKHFYAAQEVLDVLNLLAAIVDPADELAVVGVLRSPFGAVTDRELVTLRHAAALSPFHADRVPAGLAHVRAFYERLVVLHRRSARIPASDLLAEILEQFPVLPLARATRRRDQAVANVRKVLDALDVPGITLAAALEEQRRRLRYAEDEGEAVVGDEAVDAVRIMSIHKAKGLEFPVVVLADLHREPPIAERRPVLQEWVRGRVGFRCGEICTRDWIVAEERYRRVQEEEERRVLYVALTRAKDRLLLTGGRPDKGLLGLIVSALEAEGLSIGSAGRQTLRGQGFEVEVSLRDADAASGAAVPPAPSLPAADYAGERRLWLARDAERRRITAVPLLRRPSASDVAVPGAGAPPDDEGWFDAILGDDDLGPAATLGAQCHEVLARMDLGSPEAVVMDRPIRDILGPFFSSPAFRELQRADRLYRELPFLIRLDGCTWSGQIDVLYRIDDTWIVADYKSDRLVHPQRYRAQAEVYTAAAKHALGLREPPEFRLIFLRTGRVISMSAVSTPRAT
jgi:ATP-dependent helicase/nuclease subunit A